MDNELQFLKGPFYKDFESYIKKLLDQEVNKMMYSKDSNDIFVCQGKVQAYTTLLSLRGQVV